MSDIIKCETCGEADAVIHLANASLCDDCGEAALQQELTPIFGFKPCCTIVWHGRSPAICMERAGIEHDHN